MNQYLKNLNKIEFVVTYACTGRCKHCSERDHTACGERIDPPSAFVAGERDIMEKLRRYRTEQIGRKVYKEVV